MAIDTLNYDLLDYRNEGIWKDTLALQVATFPDMTEAKLRHILLDSDSRTIVLACRDRGKIVGLNGFIAHSVNCNGSNGIAFQSCLTATNPDYRGRGIFQGLINTAKEILAPGSENGFIFGYPNHNSEPIFCRKLGFNRRDMISIDFPRSVFSRYPSLVFDTNRLAAECADLDRRVQFDARSTAQWKASSPNGSVVESEDYTNFVFGRQSNRLIAGTSLNLFQVGGFEMNKPPIFNRIIARAASGCSLVRLVLPEDSPFAKARRFVRAVSKTEPLIDFPLNWPSSELSLEAWSGLKDVY